MQYRMESDFAQSQGEVPEGLRINTKKSGECSSRLEKDSRRMEDQEEIPEGWKFIMERWKEGGYKIVLDKLELTDGWTEDAKYIKEALIEWMTENEVTTMVEEGEDILDGLESMLTEEGSGATEEVLMDATEVITAI